MLTQPSSMFIVGDQDRFGNILKHRKAPYAVPGVGNYDLLERNLDKWEK